MSEPLEIFDWMSPQERAGRAYRNRDPVVKRVRPCDQVVALSDEEKTELAGLPTERRLDRFRELQKQRQDSAVPSE